jgi:hypothetical protein
VDKDTWAADFWYCYWENNSCDVAMGDALWYECYWYGTSCDNDDPHWDTEMSWEGYL